MIVLFLCLAFGAGLPSFEWADDHSGALPLLKITFPDGKEDDFAVLKHFDIIPVGRNQDPAKKDNCIYDGYLTNEKEVYVTLTGGCAYSDSFDVRTVIPDYKLGNFTFHCLGVQHYFRTFANLCLRCLFCQLTTWNNTI